MSKPEVSRRDEHGDRIALVVPYAPGDGRLSFVARDPRTGHAVSPMPTEEECRAACPDGWEVYPDGPYFRARRGPQTQPDFANTRKALAVYDASQADRDKLWNDVQSDRDVFAAEETDADALALVQEAFWQDTKAYNSRENCSHIHITDARRMIAGD